MDVSTEPDDMDKVNIEVTQGARDKLAEYVKDHPETKAIRVFLQEGG